MLDTLLTAFVPMFVELLAFIATVIFGWVALAVRRYLGVQAEKVMRDALHQAIETGLKHGKLFDGLEGKAAEAAIAYAKRSVPDAIRGLGATEAVLLAIARSKFTDLKNRAR